MNEDGEDGCFWLLGASKLSFDADSNAVDGVAEGDASHIAVHTSDTANVQTNIIDDILFMIDVVATGC